MKFFYYLELSSSYSFLHHQSKWSTSLSISKWLTRCTNSEKNFLYRNKSKSGKLKINFSTSSKCLPLKSIDFSSIFQLDSLYSQDDWRLLVEVFNVILADDTKWIPIVFLSSRLTFARLSTIVFLSSRLTWLLNRDIPVVLLVV